MEKEQSLQFKGAKESQDLLVKKIGVGGMTFGEVLEFAKRQDIWFGPARNVLDVLASKQTIGSIEFDPGEEMYKVIEPQNQPTSEDS